MSSSIINADDLSFVESIVHCCDIFLKDVWFLFIIVYPPQHALNNLKCHVMINIATSLNLRSVQTTGGRMLVQLE